MDEPSSSSSSSSAAAPPCGNDLSNGAAFNGILIDLAALSSSYSAAAGADPELLTAFSVIGSAVLGKVLLSWLTCDRRLMDSRALSLTPDLKITILNKISLHLLL